MLLGLARGALAACLLLVLQSPEVRPSIHFDSGKNLVLLEGWSAIQPGLHVSVSVGLACARGPAGVDDLYPRADAALYAAKAAGSGLQRIAH